MTLQEKFMGYGAYHRSRGNRLCHYAGLPWIGAAFVGLCAHAAIGWFDGGMVVLALLCGYYLTQEVRLGILTALISPAIYFVGISLPLWAQIAGFVLGNAVALGGHILFEAGGPASLKEGVAGLWIGPLWFLNELVRVVRN